jgi:hypothetical protein
LVLAKNSQRSVSTPTIETAAASSAQITATARNIDLALTGFHNPAKSP